MEEDTPFAKQLKNVLGKGLKPTTTRLTRSDGSVFQVQGQGTVEIPCKDKGYSPGFVIDNKPDLSVAQIKPWLFISSQDVALEPSILQKYGITTIISLIPSFDLPSSDSQMAHYCLEVYDEPSFNIYKPFEEGVGIIQGGDLSRDKFLVHCNAGLSRAPSFAIYYLMRIDGLPFEEALKMVKGVRTSARPNEGFVKQLKAFN